jgi:hypothetical protein
MNRKYYVSQCTQCRLGSASRAGNGRLEGAAVVRLWQTTFAEAGFILRVPQP